MVSCAHSILHLHATHRLVFRDVVLRYALCQMLQPPLLDSAVPRDNVF